MAQDGTTAGGASYTLDNVTFPVGRTKLQSIFDAIRSTNIGNDAPDLVAGQFWIDNNTPSTTVWTMYFYDGTDSIQFATIDTINNTVNFIDSTFDLINDTTPQLGGTLDANGNDIDMGTNTITDTKVGQWDTAYSWGDHSTEGYITASSTDTLTNKSGNISQWTNDSGYLTSETDSQTLSFSNPNLSISNGNSVDLSALSSGISNVVEDTNPQLGGNLDLNSNDITGTGNINITGTIDSTGDITGSSISLADNNKILLGDSGEFQIWHTSGGGSNITETGTGSLSLSARDIYLGDIAGTNRIKIDANLGDISFYEDTGTTPKFFWDASGESLGIGRTAGGNIGDTTGLWLGSNGFAYMERESSTPLYVRRGNDGTIIHFFTSTNTTVATIGSFSDNLVIDGGSGKTGLRVANDGIIPRDSGADSDNGVDLGASNIRWKDLYLGGGAVISEATLTDGATISWDVSTSSVAKVTLGGNRTLSAPSNALDEGQFISLLVIQDGTGSRTLTWNAVYEFASDTAPTLTTTGGKGDLFVFRYNGTKWLEVGRNLNLSLS